MLNRGKFSHSRVTPDTLGQTRGEQRKNYLALKNSLPTVIYTSYRLIEPTGNLGYFAAIIRQPDRKLHLYGADTYTSCIKLNLHAINYALKQLTPPTKTIVFVERLELMNNLYHLDRWARNAFVNKDGEPLEHAEQWRRLYTLVSQHRLSYHLLHNTGSVYYEHPTRVLTWKANMLNGETYRVEHV